MLANTDKLLWIKIHFWSHSEIAGKNLSVPHSQQDWWKSSQPARRTYNLQPDLLGSFLADVCPDITGQFGCGHRAKFRPLVFVVVCVCVGGGGGGGGGEFGRTMGVAERRCSGLQKGGRFQEKITHSSHSSHQISSDTQNCIFPSTTFLPRTIISSTSPSQQKLTWRTDILRNRSDLLGAPEISVQTLADCFS